MGQAYSAPLVRLIPSTLRQLIMYMQNARSAGIDECIVRLEKKGIVVPEPVKKNLTALAEVKDNAVHSISVSPRLSKCLRLERHVSATSSKSESTSGLGTPIGMRASHKIPS